MPEASTIDLFSFLSQFDSLSTAEAAAIAEQLSIRSFPKGTVLVREGEISRDCYFVLKGCLRQYRLIDGIEKTIQFYTEEQSITFFSSYVSQKMSDCYLACLEDVTLIVGNLGQEMAMYKQYPKLEQITRSMVEQDFGKVQDAFAEFIASSPEARYLNLLTNRPDLLKRVPQYQLASYIGVTPESLSRIRKRVAKAK
ncbi:Crp/Fnr family transcriptional regulator [Spirosoma daeguense]